MYNKEFYFEETSKRLNNNPVTRKICFLLNIKPSKAKRRMHKFAPDYLVDQENLEYWGNDVPNEVITALGRDIVIVSNYVSKGGSLNKIYNIKLRNRELDIKHIILSLAK